MYLSAPSGTPILFWDCWWKSRKILWALSLSSLHDSSNRWSFASLWSTSSPVVATAPSVWPSFIAPSAMMSVAFGRYLPMDLNSRPNSKLTSHGCWVTLVVHFRLDWSCEGDCDYIHRGRPPRGAATLPPSSLAFQLRSPRLRLWKTSCAEFSVRSIALAEFWGCARIFAAFAWSCSQSWRPSAPSCAGSG